MATPIDLPPLFLVLLPAVCPLGAKLFYIICKGTALLLLEPEFPFFLSVNDPSLMMPSLAKTLDNLSINYASNFWRLFWVNSFWQMKLSNWLVIIFIMACSFLPESLDYPSILSRPNLLKNFLLSYSFKKFYCLFLLAFLITWDYSSALY